MAFTMLATHCGPVSLGVPGWSDAFCSGITQATFGKLLLEMSLKICVSG
jgi:hypothetical protein